MNLIFFNKNKKSNSELSLSNTTLFPWTFLACKNIFLDLEQNSSLFEKSLSLTLTQFHLNQKKINDTVFLFSKDKYLNPKEKIITLFYASVHLYSQFNDVSFCLGLYDTLGEQIKSEDLRYRDFNESLTPELQSWTAKKAEIQLTDHTQIYLNQIDISSNNMKIDLQQWLKEFKEKKLNSIKAG